ncbi:MAG: hypothetical protein R3E96_10355 [Planctomycetota bacterium]
MTQWNHFRQGLADLLARADLHGRLLQGSDWPLPAIDVLYNLGALERAGFLDRDDLAPLREIYTSNPLLFDLALKRAVHHPETGQRFGDGVFLARPGSLLTGLHDRRGGRRWGLAFAPFPFSIRVPILNMLQVPALRPVRLIRAFALLALAFLGLLASAAPLQAQGLRRPSTAIRSMVSPSGRPAR